MWKLLLVLYVSQGIVSSESNATDVNPEVYMNIVSFNLLLEIGKMLQITVNNITH